MAMPVTMLPATKAVSATGSARRHLIGATEVVPLVTRATKECDPFLMFSLGAWPLTEWLRRALREAGKLDEFRRQIGLPSND